MITIGQVGLGAWGKNHFRTFSGLKDCRLKICCDKNEETFKRIEPLGNRNLKFSTDFNDILSDNEVEAVVISSSAPTHAALAGRAIEAGKHVLVEKPLALNLKDGREIINEGRRNKRIVMVGHLLLYHPAILKLKEYIKSGGLG